MSPLTTPRSTRFALGGANRCCVSTTTLINGASSGTYPSRPAISEDSQYPMANLLNLDRFSVWRSANALTGTYDVEWDLGSVLSIDVFAVHGFRRAAGQTSPNAVDISALPAASSYSAGGTWGTAVATALALSGRDAGIHLAAPIRTRYVRFRLGVGGTGGGFSIGNFYVGNLSYDLGILYSPGARNRLIRPELRTPLMAGALVLNSLGDARYGLSLPYGAVELSRKDTLRTVAAETSPLTYISPFDEFYQALPAQEHEHSHQWQAGERGMWDSVLEMETLG